MIRMCETLNSGCAGKHQFAIIAVVVGGLLKFFFRDRANTRLWLPSYDGFCTGLLSFVSWLPRWWNTFRNSNATAGFGCLRGIGGMNLSDFAATAHFWQRYGDRNKERHAFGAELADPAYHLSPFFIVKLPPIGALLQLIKMGKSWPP